MDKKTMTLLLSTLTPALVDLRRALETSRWDNGQVLTQGQKEHSAQLIIAYEDWIQLPEAERIGYVERAKCHDE